MQCEIWPVSASIHASAMDLASFLCLAARWLNGDTYTRHAVRCTLFGVQKDLIWRLSETHTTRGKESARIHNENHIHICPNFYPMRRFQTKSSHCTAQMKENMNRKTSHNMYILILFIL